MCSVIANSKKRGLLNNVREKLDGLKIGRRFYIIIDME
ncbi:MAG: hypothetical protein MOIL_00798 [Candidatus Methanolliviera sp. GoM_oil]|nr:MAG: hypothetical protein MOIL_00798 [Candidatus Methanolliviera sp. GoM_oil]